MATIEMGNDQFILYVRKNLPQCAITNDQLGKRIWVWIRDQDPAATQLNHAPALWGDTAENLGELGLPKTATQFQMDRSLLPALFDMLDSLGR